MVMSIPRTSSIRVTFMFSLTKRKIVRTRWSHASTSPRKNERRASPREESRGASPRKNRERTSPRRMSWVTSPDQILIPRKFTTSGMVMFMFGSMKIKGSQEKNVGKRVRRFDAQSPRRKTRIPTRMNRGRNPRKMSWDTSPGR